MDDFKWPADDVAKRPTRMYELVPLRPTVDGYHDALGYMCKGMVLPGPTATPWTLPPQPSAVRPSPNPTGAHPIVWRMPFPKDIVESLVSSTNPQETVNNSELELAGAVVHSDCVAQCFVVKERTTLARADNILGLWWQYKGSATYTSAPAHLLRLQAMHQWFHSYVPRVDFVSGVDNLISDRPSRSADLTDNQLLTYLKTHFPPAAAMATVDPVAQTHFWHSFRSATEDISKGLSTGRATAANGHWTKWNYSCASVALNPLIVAYQDPVPILNAFSRDY